VTAALHQATTTVPVVFTTVSDPVGAGFVAGLPHPGGNMTGFIHTDAAMGGKWVGLLKEIAPSIKRAAIMFNPDTAPGRGSLFLGSFEAGARSLALEPATLPVHNDAEIESAIAAIGRDGTGLVLMDDSFMAVHYLAVISAAARNGVLAISVIAQFVRDGGLIAYQTSIMDRGRLCRPHPARRQACRPPGADADEVRDFDQSQDRQSARPDCSARAARHR
jgi:putative tryptophan/tyrosine transport system substrate-binding protein